MSRNKHANNGQKRRKVRLTVALGDPGKPRPNKVIEPIHPATDGDADGLTTREMVNLLLKAGAPYEEVFGIDHCYEHFDRKYKLIRPDVGTPPSVNYGFDIVYCRNCWQWFRNSKPDFEAQEWADSPAYRGT